MLAVWTENGRYVQPAPTPFAASHERRTVIFRLLSGLSDLEIRRFVRTPPLNGERVDRYGENLLERIVRIDHSACLLQDLADGLVAPAAGDVRPERLAVTIWEVLPRVVQLNEVGKLLALRRVAHPHDRVRVHWAERQILRHPLDEP